MMMEGQCSRCKIVVVGDTQCGKTALLHVFAKDSYPENYVPTVFENYTASFEIDKHRIELNMWDTSGSSYYDNVRPLAYPDCDAVLICFDISRPETLDSIPKKWQVEAQEYCPSAKLVLVGCKLDMRTDVSTLRELSKQRLIPVTHEQVSEFYLLTSSLLLFLSLWYCFADLSVTNCVKQMQKELKKKGLEFFVWTISVFTFTKKTLFFFFFFSVIF
uniref:Rho-related GTP-binding protein RhoN-like n=1 Tax=Sinocyclocheilus anshuiensis TaxID=1608454 RepID=A0A671QQI5_9TELE